MLVYCCYLFMVCLIARSRESVPEPPAGFLETDHYRCLRKNTFYELLLCSPAAETALQPPIWCSDNELPNVQVFSGGVLSSQTPASPVRGIIHLLYTMIANITYYTTFYYIRVIYYVLV